MIESHFSQQHVLFTNKIDRHQYKC